MPKSPTSKEYYNNLLDLLKNERKIQLEKIKCIQQIIHETGLGLSYWSKKSTEIEMKLNSTEFLPVTSVLCKYFSFFDDYFRHNYEKECLEVKEKLFNLQNLIKEIDSLFVIVNYKKTEIIKKDMNQINFDIINKNANDGYLKKALDTHID